MGQEQMNPALVARIQEEIQTCREEGMDAEDIQYMAEGAGMRYARDTQFAGFGEALLEDMFRVTGRRFIDFTSVDEDECNKYRELFTQRAYDLALHILKEMNVILYQNGASLEKVVESVPDMTTLPKK